MSRHEIIVRGRGVTDDNAIIGYDPPLRTYFLQALEDPESGDLDLWLGTRLEEFSDLAALVALAAAAGFIIGDLSDDVVADMLVEQRAAPAQSFVERLGWCLR